jgi:hypothetical protein
MIYRKVKITVGTSLFAEWNMEIQITNELKIGDEKTGKHEMQFVKCR